MLKKFSLLQFLKLIRLNNYIKNFLIFLPWFFEHNLDMQLLSQLGIVFILFSLITSCNYILNDIIDIKEDRKHNVKKKRPLASNFFQIKQAYFIILILLVLCAYILFNFYYLDKVKIIIYFSIYLFIANLYTLTLKNIIFLDIFVLTFFYLFRIKMGGDLVNIEISQWLYFFSFFSFFYLATTKKILDTKHFKEFKNKYNEKNLKHLSNISHISIYLSIITLFMYIISDQIKIYDNHLILYLLIPFALALHFRLIFLIEKKIREEFISIFYKDKILGCIILSSIIVILISY